MPGYGGQIPNSQRVGNPRPHSFGISNRAKLASGIFAIAVTFGGIIWVANETIEGKKQETRIFNECKKYYAKLNAQMESRGLPPFATGEILKEYCEEWVANPPGFKK